MPTDHSYFLESVVEAYSDAQIARAESTPLTSEKTSPRAPQASERACSRCGTVTSAYGPRNKATCRPCLSKAVNAKQHEGGKPTVYAITVDEKVVYCGSTTLNLKSRLTAHLSATRQGRTLLLSRYLASLSPEQKVNIVALETLPKGSSTQTLHFAEYTWIKNLSKTNKLYQSIGLK